MRSMQKVHLRRMVGRLEFKLACCLSVLACTASFVEECMGYFGYDGTVLPSAALAWVGHYAANGITFLPLYFFILFPVVITSVYSDSLTLDRLKGMASILAVRSNLTDYLRSIVGAIATGTFCVTTIPLFATLMLSLTLFPLTSSEYGMKITMYDTLDTMGSNYGLLLGNLFVSHPYLYDILRITYIGLFAAVIGIACFVASLYVRKSRFVLVGATAGTYLVATLILPPPLRPGNLLLPTFFLDGLDLAQWIGIPLVILACSMCALIYAMRRLDVLL
ncbi:MAG: hypothetical protein MR610_05710 [Olsenella sp.]|nr:hypothetical protein [Olsenella sp.]